MTILVQTKAVWECLNQLAENFKMAWVGMVALMVLYYAADLAILWASRAPRRRKGSPRGSSRES